MSDSISFAEQVDAAIAGKMPFYSALKVCDTPKILQEVGFAPLPMLYTQKHLRNAILPKNDKSHKHGLSVEQIKKLPELIEAPAIIFDSVSRNDSVVVVSNEIDSDGNPIIISVKGNGIGRYELETLQTNFITSVYGKNDFANYIHNVIPSDNFLYLNKVKSQDLFKRWGLQSSELINNLDSNVIIHKSRNIVNTNKTNKEEIFMPKSYFAGDILQIKNENSIINQYVVIEAGKDSLSCFAVSSGDFDEKTHVAIAPDERNKLTSSLCVKTDKLIKISAEGDYKLSSARLSAVDVQSFIEKHNALNIKAKAIDIKQSAIKSDIVDRSVVDVGENFKLDPSTIADYMAYRAKFTKYSAQNQLRIYAQNPHATFVKTYKQWADMGHKVIKKGAIQLLQPAFCEYFKDENGNVKKVSQASSLEKAAIAKGEIETWVKKRFDVFNVFDISQTNCPPSEYPKFFEKGFESKQHNDIYRVLRQIAENNGIAVSVEDVNSISLHGYYSPKEDKIVLSDKLSDTELAHTMSHELAHALMHKTTTQVVDICEFEADCLSMQLSAKFGLDTSETNKHHLAQAFRKIPQDHNLNESFERVHKAYSFVEKQFDDTAREMGISFEIQKQQQTQQNVQQDNTQNIDNIAEVANFSVV